jgi:ankyrin repeat protein
VAKTETIERGHTIRVMPTQEQQKWYRILAYVGIAALVIAAGRFIQYNNQAELEAASARGDLAGVKQCLTGAFIGVDRRPALNVAAATGRGNVVRFLLAEGQVKPADGLEAAARGGQGDVLRLLIESGATVRGERGGPLLWRAAQSGSAEAVYVLVRYGAARNLHNPMDDGLTALMYAADSGKPGVVKAMVDAKADVKARSKSGRTALMIAAAANDPQACKFLLDAGADINARDDKGRTALMSAAVVGNYDTLDYLLNRGASTLAKDNRGKTARDHALQVGDAKSINRLRRAGERSLALR